MDGFDRRVSPDPGNWKRLVHGLRSVEAMRTSDRLEPHGDEIEFRSVSCQNLVAGIEIFDGTEIDAAMISVRRLGNTPANPTARFEIVMSWIALARNTIG